MGQQIVSLGDLVLDVILPVTLPVLPGQHQNAGSRRLEPGGASNFMIAARHMGLAVSSVGTVGDDVFGAQVLSALHHEGIDTTYVVVMPHTTSTLVMVLTDQKSGEHTFIGDYGQGPNVPYPAGLDAHIAGADALFVQGYTLSEARLVPLATRAIMAVNMAHIPLYLDVGPFMAHVAPSERRWVSARATTILMTEDEIPLISDGHTGATAYDYLFAQGVQTLVIKQGPDGCRIITPDQAQHVPGFSVPVVDTVGAGDCFDAAFIAGRLAELPLYDCGRLANAMGAAAVQRVGAGRNAPTCTDVLAILDAAREEIPFSC